MCVPELRKDSTCDDDDDDDDRQGDAEPPRPPSPSVSDDERAEKRAKRTRVELDDESVGDNPVSAVLRSYIAFVKSVGLKVDGPVEKSLERRGDASGDEGDDGMDVEEPPRRSGLD